MFDNKKQDDLSYFPNYPKQENCASPKGLTYLKHTQKKNKNKKLKIKPKELRCFSGTGSYF